ncbi:unnamed protein product [Trichobilharzia szidati]|nr:unnamed protein product [Trichobilharzia szidati]
MGDQLAKSRMLRYIIPNVEINWCSYHFNIHSALSEILNNFYIYLLCSRTTVILTFFLYISNAGGNYINRRTYEHLVGGKKREDLRYTDIDRVLAKSAFNNEGLKYLCCLIPYIISK